MKPLKVLVACEESQEVCKAFRELGHEAYSCDIQECSGGHPEWHTRGDVKDLLDPVNAKFSPDCQRYGILPFLTMDNELHLVDGKWDLIIAHPPCQKLSNACAVNLGRKDSVCSTKEWREKFFNDRTEAAIFFMTFLCANCDHIAVENPAGYMSTHFRKPDQYIDPYMFGEPWKKQTGLWLKGLPKLKPTNIVTPTGKWVQQNKMNRPAKSEAWEVIGFRDAKTRSKTFTGIARAMAEQWSAYIEQTDT